MGRRKLLDGDGCFLYLDTRDVTYIKNYKFECF